MDNQTATQNNAQSIEDELADYLSSQQSGEQLMQNQQSTEEIEEENAENSPQKFDLLSQIAAVDRESEEADKKKQKKSIRKQISFSKIFSIAVMRSTLMIDEIRHKYASVFRAFAILWSVITIFIYIGGIVSLSILIYVYKNYPNYVRQYFESNKIELASWDMSEYSLSQIELKNIKSKDGLYTIRRAVIRSNFSDFLRGHIKAVTLEGATIKIREKGNHFEVGGLVKSLMQLNRKDSKYHIGSISVPNVALNIEGEKYKIPVLLSITGVYDNAPSVTIPLSIKHQYMNLSGQVIVSGSGDKLDWDFDISSGVLSFPNRQPENVTGKFKIRTEKITIASINGSLDMSYGKNNKKIRVDLKHERNFYRGTLGLSLANMEVRDKSDETKTHVQMAFEGLDIKNFSHISTSKPIRLNIQSFYTQDFSLNNFSGLFKGDLKCNNFVCSYQIKSDVPVTVQNNRMNLHGSTYVSTDKLSMTFKSNNRTNLILDNDGLKFDFALADGVYSGSDNSKNNARIQLSAKSIALSGQIQDKNIGSKVKLKAEGVSYSSGEISFNNGDIQIADIFKEGSSLQFKSPAVTMKNNQLLKKTFSIDMRREKEVVGASLALLNNKLQIRYIGSANLLAGSFSGNIVVLPFDLKSVSGNLNSISDLFPSFIENASGKIALYGKIAWKSEKQVDGPFYLMAEDVSFEAGNVKVSDVNTVLVVQTLVPFITSGGQEIFVGKVDSFFPFRNLNTMLKFDNQMMRIAKLNTSLNGINLSLDNLIIPYRTNSTTVYLRNQEVNFAQLNNRLGIEGLSVTGAGSVNLPIEIKDGLFELANAEVRLSNVSLKYFGKNREIRNALFKNSNEYLLKTGSILLSQGTDNQMSAYLNFDGRMLPSQIRSNYSNTIRFDPKKIFISDEKIEIPETIKERQSVLKSLLEKQK